MGKTLHRLKNSGDKEVVVATEKLIKKWKNLLKEQKLKQKGPETSTKSPTNQINHDTKDTSESTTPSQGNKKIYNLDDKEIKDLKASILNENIETFRKNIRNLIFESFIENLPEDFIPSQAANKTKVIEDKMFKSLSKDDYLRKAKVVATNISDKNNVDFINDILSGKISEDEIPKMDARSMASKNKKKEIKQQQNNMFDSIRSDWDLIHAPVFEGMYTCNKCGHKRTKTQELQMRASDEPMTLFITCLNCRHKWKL